MDRARLEIRRDVQAEITEQTRVASVRALNVSFNAFVRQLSGKSTGRTGSFAPIRRLNRMGHTREARAQSRMQSSRLAITCGLLQHVNQ